MNSYSLPSKLCTISLLENMLYFTKMNYISVTYLVLKHSRRFSGSENMKEILRSSMACAWELRLRYVANFQLSLSGLPTVLVNFKVTILSTSKVKIVSYHPYLTRKRLLSTRARV